MAWGTDLPKIEPKVGPPFLADEIKHAHRVILYFTAKEKELYQRRAAEKGQSVSHYIRTNLRPITDKLREMYDGRETQQEKED